MLQSVSVIENSQKRSIDFIDNHNFKIVVGCNSINSKCFELELVFQQPIISFRNHDYNWVDSSIDRVANSYCSKVIKLQDGTLVQANINKGIWEINPKRNNVLLWKFNPEFSNSITQYTGISNTKKLVSATSNWSFQEQPALLFSTVSAIEASRSKIPFSAIVCFTDHCDYDTLENLKLQRQLFKETNLKVTKGFFLNHFSKRATNASVEKNATEIELWKKDGHELCYHSLSQSIKSDEESFLDFKNFQPPYTAVPVWIDHGFQPYNFSLYTNNGISNKEYESNLLNKNIAVLWNYIDSGTATLGVINQLNPNQFTLQNFAKAISDFSLKTRIILLFKNIIFHYDNDEFRVRNYINCIEYIRAIIKNKNVKKIIPLFKNGFPILKVVLKVIFNWNTVKKKTYKVAKYTPVFFKHRIDNKEFTIFQTLEMVDLKKALAPENIDLLIKESGLFVAHTYFSVDMSHYLGKLFKQENIFDETVVANFKNLGNKIQENSIWNPTLSELINYWNEFEKIVFDVAANGTIFVKNTTSITTRNLK
ncbi:hypothetical protein OX283_006980 [Flavobacterium sp. SUN052]|uniref:hypothetical protein n=1 Tax=Flavobacterium sp. SUN052 TaxID=3002441 RepID=UPI00237D6E47|nr:hypothetical protein [Flavobacterium sp. SUN052]MEC4004393.1 hypothetical protein [Flavobacterium sp. SUN052]